MRAPIQISAQNEGFAPKRSQTLGAEPTKRLGTEIRSESTEIRL